MTPAERRRRLEEARGLVESVRDDVPAVTAACAHCGAERFVDWNLRQAREHLGGVLTRIDKVLDRLDAPAPADHPGGARETGRTA